MKRTLTVLAIFLVLVTGRGAIWLAADGPGVGAAPPSDPACGIDATVDVSTDLEATDRVTAVDCSVGATLTTAEAALDHPVSVLARAAPERINLPPTVPRVGPVLLFGYSRYDRSDPLALENRRALFESITEVPGRSLAQHADRVDMPVSTVRYHSRILVHERLARTEVIRGRRRLFPTTGGGDDDVAAALADDATRPIMNAVVEHAPVSVSTLADAVDRAPSTVSYHLDRLEDADLIVRHRAGGAVHISPTRDVAVALDGGDERWVDRR